jgi:cyclase
MTFPTEPVLEFADFTVYTLAPGVHAAIAKRMSGAVANAGIIDLGDRTLVFDTFMCLPAARDLQRAAIQLTGRPAAYVVNSHPHPDHIHGNVVFGDEAVIVATSATRADLLTSGVRWLDETRSGRIAGLRAAEEQARNAADDEQRKAAQGLIQQHRAFLDGLPAPDELRYPTLTFEQKLTLHGAARRVELVTFGGGHSPSDAILWLPEERIAFTADVVVNGGPPFLVYGDPEQWLHILDEIDRLGPAIIVPGHGPVQAPATTAPVRQYITDILDVAARAAREGITPETADKVDLPDAFKALPMPHLFRYNLAAVLRRMGQQAG